MRAFGQGCRRGPFPNQHRFLRDTARIFVFGAKKSNPCPCLERRNETHLRRNMSRWRHAERGVVNLECQGTFVLPEIIRMQASQSHHTPASQRQCRILPNLALLFRIAFVDAMHTNNHDSICSEG